jgi:hypothetical protein
VKDRKKHIIIKEIKHWKEHRLIPAHYCDFLLTLYTEGEQTKETVFNLRKILFLSYLSFLFFLLPLTVLIIHFTEMSLVLQMAVFTIFIIFNLVTYIFTKKKEHTIYKLPLISGLLIALLASIDIVNQLFSSNPFAIPIMILVNCMIWIAIGWKDKLFFISIAGGAGLIFFFGYFFI